MEINFTKDYLKELYREGRAHNKKYRFQKDIVKRYKRTIDILQVVEHPNELFQFRALNFEALKGDKEGLYSVRVSQKYRLEFKVYNLKQNQMFISICDIEELSNHYK